MPITNILYKPAPTEVIVEKEVSYANIKKLYHYMLGRNRHLPTLNAAVLKVASVYDFRAHPYLIWMQLDSTSRDEFRLTQLPFRFAVESFSQALAAVLARIPVLEARLPIFFNIAEEHGGGDRKISHKYTFRQYLQALGATESELSTPCTTSVLAFAVLTA